MRSNTGTGVPAAPRSSAKRPVQAEVALDELARGLELLRDATKSSRGPGVSALRPKPGVSRMATQ